MARQVRAFFVPFPGLFGESFTAECALEDYEAGLLAAEAGFDAACGAIISCFPSGIDGS